MTSNVKSHDQERALNNMDADESHERKKAKRTGLHFFTASVAFFLLSIFAAFGDFPRLAFTAVGVWLLLLVVGLLLVADSERQRRRDPRKSQSK